MKDTLIIIGAGGHGKVCLDVALSMDKWKKIYFLDDSNKKEILDHKIIGKTSDAYLYKEQADFFVAIGNNKTRSKVLDSLEQYSIVSLIHCNSVIGSDVTVGKGTVLMPGSIINASTKIGKGVIVNTKVSVDHDCNIGDYVHLSPGTTLSGSVTIGKNSWLGTGSNVINNICISSDIIVGAGSLTIKNLEEKGVYYGTPSQKHN